MTIVFKHSFRIVTVLVFTQVARNDKGWKNWFDKEAPEEEQMPDGYSISLDTFRKLLLVRFNILLSAHTFLMEKIYCAMFKYNLNRNIHVCDSA